MIRKYFLLAIILLPMAVHALSLNEARSLARDNYPAIRQYRMIEQSRNFTLDNVVKGWLPQVSISTGAYGFTDILKSDQRMEQMGMDMNNYLANASVMIKQSVYDGGQIAARKKVVWAESQVQKQLLDVSMYAINEQVDQLFFSILLLDEQLKQNALLQKDLATSEQTIRSMMTGGVANQTDLDAILVERLKTELQNESLLASRQAYLRMLGVFVGKDLVAAAETLEKPAQGYVRANVNRPELNYYASQNLLLDAQRKRLNTLLRPTVGIFGMGMVHSKMSEMLNNGMMVAGVSVSWNIGALYTHKNDIRKIEVQRQMNDSQRELFLFNNRLQNEEAGGAIASLKRQIEKDEEIVRLRENIRGKSDRKVELGTKSVNELVSDINAVSLARAQKAMHEIQLLKETYRQKNINNE